MPIPVRFSLSPFQVMAFVDTFMTDVCGSLQGMLRKIAAFKLAVEISFFAVATITHE